MKTEKFFPTLSPDGEGTTCERCGIEMPITQDLCDECYDYYFCECGRRLCEEEGASPGDGFCQRCR